VFSRQCSIRAEYEGLRSRQMGEMDVNGEVVVEIGLYGRMRVALMFCWTKMVRDVDVEV
jgi:hypothetical protein